MNVGSQFARSAITFSNKMARLATHRNAMAGNICRVLKGLVPSHKAPYGYLYRREAEITNGRIFIQKAWWEVNEQGSFDARTRGDLRFESKGGDGLIRYARNDISYWLLNSLLSRLSRYIGKTPGRRTPALLFRGFLTQ
jgi:hypothetical protein